MHVAIVAELAASKGVQSCVPLPSAAHGCRAGGAGGAWLGEVFKPGLVPPGGLAVVPGVGLRRCRFVAGLPMRVGPPPVLLLGRARSLTDVGSGSRARASRSLCTVLVGAAGNVE